MDTIEKVIYINLEHRTDRKEQVESELLKVFPLEKIVRFNAIKHKIGAIGCSMSHIGCIEMAIQNNWKNVLIVEDDLQWKDFDNGCYILSNLVKAKYDVIMLGGYSVSYDRSTYKLKRCTTTLAYLVQTHYYSKLLDNYKTGLSFLKATNDYSKYALDRYNYSLQEKHNWYIIIPQMCIQRPSFSDIENKNVDYTRYLNIKWNPFKNVRFNPK